MGGSSGGHRRDGSTVLAAFAQQRLWFLAELDSSSPAYNEPLMIEFREALDTAALAQALTEIVRRHEILRTTFFNREGQVFQRVEPAAQVALPIVDLFDWPKSEREPEAMRRAIAFARQPFELSLGPLFRATLMRLADDDQRLFIVAHHLVIDGLSYFQVFLGELQALYNAFRNHDPTPLPALPLQYAEFSEWQRGWLTDERLAPQLAYWKAQLLGAADLDLPTDFPRSAQPARDGARVPIALSASLSQNIKAISRSYGVSVFTVILAAWKTLLYRYSGQRDVVVGTAVAGRRRPDLGSLIGFFSNSLVLRTRLDDKLPFGLLLGRVREVLESARQHQDVPFERLILELNAPRVLNRNPLFNTTCIVMPPVPPSATAPHFRASRFDIGIAKVDLYLELHQRSSGLAGHIEYRTDLFRESSMKRMAGHLHKLLEEIARDPEQPIGTLPILTAPEQQEIARFCSGPSLSVDPDLAVPFPQLFEKQVAATPDAVAIVFQDQSLSYRELNRRANKLAHHLRSVGVGPDVLVGIYLERSIEAIVGLLAIHKAGGAYLPLDPAYPKERIRFMLEDAELQFLLTQSALREQLPMQPARSFCFDTDWPAIEQSSPENLPPQATLHHLAYAIYTSGSTGKPKGALIEHRSLTNLSRVQKELFAVRGEDRILQFTSMSFDVSVGDFALALTTGARLVLAPNATLLPGAELQALLREQAITILALPPSALAALPMGDYPALRTIIVGGEPISHALFVRFEAGDRLRIAYGLTECTVMSTCGVARDPQAASSIGRPIAEVDAYILDQALQPLPVGIAGELYLGGVGLARGYLRRPELTAERFIENPLANARSPRLYKTSDRARWREDGSIEFLGRVDRQIKLRGFRIELGEIEATLGRHPDLREAAVLLHEDALGDKRLAAYVVPRSPATTASAELPLLLSNWLKEKLPDYMVPTSYTVMEALPLSPTGKLEPSAMPMPAPPLATRPGYEAPNSEIEQAIIAAWQQVLRCERIGVRDNFFDLGGHSLLLAQVQSKLSTGLLREVQMMDLFRYPTVRELAVHLSSSADLDEKESDKGDDADALKSDSRARAKLQRSALHRGTRSRRKEPPK